MALRLGVHADRLADVRDLLTARGRREQNRFSFEGATLLEEATRSRLPIEAVYATEDAYGTNAALRGLESRGTAIYLIEERSAGRISDLDTPTGLVAVAPVRFATLDELFAEPGLVLVLADLNDPGNAGTLMRSAEAFGARGVVFGRAGVDPYHPKVVRGAMGAIFRMPLAIAEPEALAEAAQRAQASVLGLSAEGEPLDTTLFGQRSVLVVGHERRGLGPWGGVCSRQLAIPMAGLTESLNAAIAGSIALYEASKRS